MPNQTMPSPARATTSERARLRLDARAAAVLLLAALASCRSAAPSAPKPTTGNLAHAVFFDLTDPRDAEALVRDCRKRLAGIPGVRLLEAGSRCPEFNGPRNDQAFDVSLWVVFDDLSAHDAYQVHPAHRALVADWTPKLAGIRVYDAWL